MVTVPAISRTDVFASPASRQRNDETRRALLLAPHTVALSSAEISYVLTAGQALAVELYREAGIRSCEIGTAMHAEHSETGEEMPSAMDLVRLAIPHRVYTQSHIDYVVEAILQVYKRRESMGGYRIISQPKFLRHFTARFEPLRN